MKKTWIVILFWLVIATGCLVAERNIPLADYFLKPLIILLLIFWLKAEVPFSKIPVLMLAGLIFSWLGDILLMFDKAYPVCFILGLLSFLITHILYSIWFIRQRKQHPAPPLNIKYLFLVFGYAILLVSFLYPHLGSLKFPVFFYALVISIMLLTTLSFPHYSQAKPYFVTGALWFIISDSLLAINKFMIDLPFASTLIRFTYAMAQFLIVAGIIRYRNTQGAVNLKT